MIPSTKRREDQEDFLEGQTDRGDPGLAYGDSNRPPQTVGLGFDEARSAEGRAGVSGDFTVLPGSGEKSLWLHQIETAIERSCRYFLSTQYPEGFWWLELESNVTITAEYVMLLHLIGSVDPKVQASAVKYLYNQQLPNGAWALYHGHEGDLSSSVEAYFALKLAGEDPDSDALRKARQFILSKGGVEAARVFTKIWLALFAQYDWDRIPTMPVEIVLLPPRFCLSIYEFSSWARGTVVPLSIVMAIRPQQPLPASKSIPELFLNGEDSCALMGSRSYLHKAFYLLDRILKIFERHPIRPLRKRAVDAAVKWVLEHQEESGDWGGIQPPMVYSVLALKYLGYPLDHPAIIKGLKALEDFCLEDGLGLRMQSCVSPVWDTALTVLALLDAGLPESHPTIQKAGKWLIDKQVTEGGDWQVKNDCLPGGWSFEFINTQYPDVDDSAVILCVLQRLSGCPCEGIESAKRRGLDWCLSMQSTCGGWAAFDRDNTLMVLNRIPFADHEAMVDYPTADVTGRMLEAMGYYGFDSSHPRARKAIQFLRGLQEHDGCWWGRWGVNYIYGTWSVLKGLSSIGEDPRQPYIKAAVKWLKEHQNDDGGWGESCETYERPELRGQGESTPSQTAWAVMGLIACGEHDSPEVQRGIQYLLRNQKSDGTWDEDHFTGTGFPRHFYIRYHNYRNCFPLMALGQYLQKLKKPC